MIGDRRKKGGGGVRDQVQINLCGNFNIINKTKATKFKGSRLYTHIPLYGV
jgi:hypothetical protein